MQTGRSSSGLYCAGGWQSGFFLTVVVVPGFFVVVVVPGFFVVVDVVPGFFVVFVVVPGFFLVSVPGFLASLPGFTLPGDTSASDRFFSQDLTEPFTMHDGMMSVPTGPGLGVAPIPEVFAELRVSGAVLYDASARG